MNAFEVPVSLELPPPKTPRSPGIHVSRIIGCIAIESGILKREFLEELSLTDYQDITDPDAILRMCIGLAWEEWYIPTILKDVVDHPRELHVSGVYMNHDGESITTVLTETGRTRAALMVHEVKTTSKSLNTVKDLESQQMWMMQIKAYCYALKTIHAMLHVLFLYGDYSKPIRPQLRCWRLEFTHEEIQDNWDFLIQYVQERPALVKLAM